MTKIHVPDEDAKVGAGVWMWWTDGSRSDDGRVGAAAGCKHANERRSRCSFLGAGRMDVFDTELWAIGLRLYSTSENRKTLQGLELKTVAVYNESQPAIQRMAHPEPGPALRLAKRII